MKEKIRAFFAENRARYEQQVIELLTDLVALRTVNAGEARLGECPGQDVPGEETRVVDLLLPLMEELGARTEVHAMHPRRANLLATIGDGERTLAVGCHTDIVPPGEGWDSDPYEATLRDGKLYGRGVLDNKGPLASCVIAMRLLRECGVELDGGFQLAAIASEEFREAGQPDPGIEYLLEKGVLKPDFAIIPDIGENMRGIDIAEKGRMELKVMAKGKQAHGSTPELGVNAVYLMAKLVNRIEQLTLPHEEHPLLAHPTINLGIIQGGAASNIVPGTCEITLDIRYVPGMKPEAIVDTVRGLTADIGGDWEFKTGDVTLPHAIEGDNLLVDVAQKNSQTVLGITPEPFGMGGGTFAKAFNLGGIPAIGFGPGDDEQFHVANESIEVKQLVDFAELLACVAVDLLGVKQ